MQSNHFSRMVFALALVSLFIVLSRAAVAAASPPGGADAAFVAPDPVTAPRVTLEPLRVEPVPLAEPPSARRWLPCGAAALPLAGFGAVWLANRRRDAT